MLLVRNGQKDAIIHSDGASKKGSGTGARNSDVPGIAAQSWAGRLGAGRCPITRLKGNPGGLRGTVRGTKAGIADEHLAVSAVIGARGHFQLSGRLS